MSTSHDRVGWTHRAGGPRDGSDDLGLRQSAEGYGDLVDWRRFALVRVIGGSGGEGKRAVTHTLADVPVKIPYT